MYYVPLSKVNKADIIYQSLPLINGDRFFHLATLLRTINKCNIFLIVLIYSESRWELMNISTLSEISFPGLIFFAPF